MKTSHRRLFTTIGCLLMLAMSANAQDYVRYRARPMGNNVRIDGKANVHDWEMEGTIIGGYLDVPVGVMLDPSQASISGASDGVVKAKAEITIPVTSILNSKYEGMSEVMQQAMNAPDHPRIQYQLEEMTLKQPHAGGAPLIFDTKGDLIVNGVTNKIAFPVSIESPEKGKLKIHAEGIPINMPDYSVKPPVKYGLFITEPGVKISFTWNIAMSKPATPK